MNVATLIEIENHDRKVIFTTQGDGGRIHHAQAAAQHFHVADLVEHGGVLHHDWVIGINAVDLGRLQNDVSFDFHGTQRGGGVGGEIRIAGASGENYDAALLQVANGATPDERLGHLVHFESTHDAGEDVLLFQRILQRKSVDHRSQHAHVIGRDAVHELGLLGHAAEEVAAADHDGDLNTQAMHFGKLSGDFMHALVVDSEALAGSQRLAGYLKKNALIDGSVHAPKVPAETWYSV